MSFHKRFLSKKSIKSLANFVDFIEFQTYLTSADAYIIEGNWASEFYDMFTYSDEKIRIEMYKKIKNESTEANSIL